MEGSAYEIAVYVLRYWFAALMVFLLFRLVRSVVRGWNEQRTRERASSSKYTVGLLEVVAPELDARGKVSPLYGRRYALRRENRIGSARKADWRLSAPGVAPLHASIYQKGDRILLSDCGTKAGVLLNGRRIPEDVALFDGDVIGLGPVRLLLHLAGSGKSTRKPTRRTAKKLTAKGTKRSAAKTVIGKMKTKTTAVRMKTPQKMMKTARRMRITEIAMQTKTATRTTAVTCSGAWANARAAVRQERTLPKACMKTIRPKEGGKR